MNLGGKAVNNKSPKRKFKKKKKWKERFTKKIRESDHAGGGRRKETKQL